jgi:hypothetical protein
MKNSVLLIVKFFVITIVLTLAASAVYYFYLLCTQIVAGLPPVFPPLSAVFPYFPLFLAMAAIAAGLVCQGITACRQMKLVPQIVAALLVLATWLVVIPGCAILAARLAPLQTAVGPASRTSAGYFRPYTGGMFFPVSGETVVGGILLRPLAQSIAPVYLNGIPAAALQAAPFSDVLVANTLRIPAFLSALGRQTLFFWQAGSQAWQGGYLSWLFFASIGLPLASLSAHAVAGTWPLKNFTGMIFMFAAVFFVNRLYALHDVSGLLARAGIVVFPAMKAASARGVFLVAFNALLGAVILATGILFSVLTSRKVRALRQ